MNTIGPYHNRQETYKYFSLPFCKGPQEEVGHHHETMGEALQGVELEFSGLQIGFKGECLDEDHHGAMREALQGSPLLSSAGWRIRSL